MIDIKGNRYNKLTVMEFSHLNNTKHAVWKCLCDCGNETFGESRYLINGKKKSCGCKQHITGKENSRWSGYNDISLSLFSKIKSEAKSRNLCFSLDIKFLWDLFEKQNRKCALSGEPIYFNSKVHVSDRTASLDRIDSSKGYEEGNVQWVHKDVNMMKQKHSTNKFLDWCKKIHLYNSLRT